MNLMHWAKFPINAFQFNVFSLLNEKRNCTKPGK